MSALGYLLWTSARNRVLALVRNVRKPRYALALVVGALYVWSFLLRPAGHTETAAVLLGEPAQEVVTLLAVLTLMGAWLFGDDGTALAFNEAEVSMLFTAPISRRGLIVYKLARLQLRLVINALIWVIVLRRGGTMLPGLLRGISVWVLFSVLALHRLGAALVRASWREHGVAGVRRHRWSATIFLAIGACLATSFVQYHTQLLNADGMSAFIDALVRVLKAPPASIGLYPFALVVAPTFARSPAAWGREILPALGILAIHAIWVLRTDTAFEEAALEASARRAKRVEAARARRSGLPVPVSTARGPAGTLSLRGTGHPAVAIVWKNMLCLRRTAPWRLFIGPVVTGLAIGVAMAGSGAGVGEMVATAALALGGMLLLFGGRFIRNDLRHDMEHLPLLKSLPLAPGDLVLAEVASATLPMTVIQLLLLFVAYISVLASSDVAIAAPTRLALLVASPIALLALNGALLTIQNGTAVLFPSWIRLGTTVTTGVETLGQNVLATGASLLALAVALIVPLVVAWGIVWTLHASRSVALALAIVLASVLLGVETWLAIRGLGRAFRRAEPAAT